MVTDQEIAKGVETVLRQSDPNAVTSLNGVVQQLEAKLGTNLSHKAAFIRDQINLLLRSHPTTTNTAVTTATTQPPRPPPQLQTQPHTLHLTPKDHFTLQQDHPPQPQFQQFHPHFALHPHHLHLHHPHQQQQQQVFPQDLNFHQAPVPPYPPPRQVQQQQLQQRTQHVAKAEVFAQNATSAPPEMPKER